ncbi:hypothetical protein BCV39_03870 [Vibrio sp. 10N.286.55.E10]|uniref:hypothetical protein n=1 Tax=unclassified Vibrio TaxID=2614977 RepID=UPI000C8186EF|nr:MULTISPECIES: hypothetical protein [unclassified Vibrio]PME29091.1 hypothetical protein BCV40_15760 [Vibrio sp. 10N.286.55.E12]PME33916.1 hypothetical protein BCV39_03870 [Vibrio sp. 10N.286.55.E10]PME63788.1 hypothetical protein BCV32_03125 [Vibrio sp. 10N.286.55.C11]
MTANNVIEIEKDITNDPDALASLPKEKLKSLFYLFAGKPDSRIKVFHKSLYIEVSDIIELNACITRKLQTNNIHAQITNVTIGYEGSDIQEFGTWSEFEDNHWQVPEKVEEVVVKWDFMVNISGFETPQRHTLLVRISSDMKPGKFMQMMVSGNYDDFDQIDVMTAPSFCRVDFINAQISKELINEVTDWVDGRKQPALITDFYFWVKKRRQTFAEVTHYSFILMYAALWVTGFLWTNTNIYVGNEIPTSSASIWVFLGIYGFTLIGKIGHMLASKVYGALDNIDGKKVVFNLTSGDKKANSEVIDANKQQGKHFIKQTAWTLFLNILAGVVATYLYVNS